MTAQRAGSPVSVFNFDLFDCSDLRNRLLERFAGLFTETEIDRILQDCKESVGAALIIVYSGRPTEVVYLDLVEAAFYETVAGILEGDSSEEELPEDDEEQKGEDESINE